MGRRSGGKEIVSYLSASSRGKRKARAKSVSQSDSGEGGKEKADPIRLPPHCPHGEEEEEEE